MNNRIRSSNVQLGESKVLGNKPNPDEASYKKALEDMLVQASDEAKALIEQAEQQAVAVKQQAMQEAEILKQQASQQGYEEGYNQGHEAGTLQARQECAENFWGLYTITSAAFAVKKEIVNSAEKEILELATAVAEKVIRNKLDLEPELMQNIIKGAIDQLQDKEEIKIIVNPALAQNLYDFAEELREKIRGIKTIKLTEDKTIPKDGVIVESPDSRIDGRVKTQLREITRNLMLEYMQKANSTEEIPEEIDIVINDKASEIDIPFHKNNK